MNMYCANNHNTNWLSDGFTRLNLQTAIKYIHWLVHWLKFHFQIEWCIWYLYIKHLQLDVVQMK